MSRTPHSWFFAPIYVLLCAATFYLVIFPHSKATAWSLKTHAWIADEVIADVIDDGAVTIGKRSYPVPGEVLQALRNSPSHYRMGHIGPDGFPDPLVGQTTTHPGVDEGWQTGQWINHLLVAARSSDEVAFAFGFAGHAAGDVFAHTYVNMYAGDIFSLTDGEREVELRHFVLEKVIESHTPSTSTRNNDFQVPANFLRDRLIFDQGVTTQYLRSGTGLHLTTMNVARQTVGEFSKGFNSGFGKLTDFLSENLKKASDISIELATARVAFDAADLSLKGAKEAFNLKNRIVQEKLEILRRGIEIIEKNPGLISLQERIIAEQLKIIADAARGAQNLNSEIGKLEKRINSLLGDLANIPAKITETVCNTVCDIAPWPLSEICDEVCKVVEKVNGAWSDLNNKITGLKNDLVNLRTKHTNALARGVEATARKAEALSRKIALEKELLVTKGLLESYKVAVKLAEAERAVTEKALQAAERVLQEARKLRDKIAAKLKEVNGIIDFANDFLKRYNLITLYLSNWQKDIDKASSAYIEASRSASLQMVRNEGGALKAYTDWFSCWGPVYTGVPGVITNPICETKNKIGELREKISSFIDDLPEPLRWLLFPMRELRKKVEEKLRPSLEKLGWKILGFITDPRTSEFLSVLSKPENATLAKLNEVYGNDHSAKGLLTFDRVSDLVLSDMKVKDGHFNFAEFIPIRNSVTLAKLALLSREQLSKIFTDNAGNVPTIYGPKLYSGGNGRYSLLTEMVRNIDGNHQWQAYGLPYPRKSGSSSPEPRDLHFGFDYFKEPSKGFRFWVDPTARAKVFPVLFPAPGPLGAIGQRDELKFPSYSFEACEENPYPQTQNDNGLILWTDTRCLSPWNPVRWIMFLFENGNPVPAP